MWFAIFSSGTNATTILLIKIEDKWCAVLHFFRLTQSAN